MNLLAGTLYDPAVAVTKATTAGTAIAAFDTTNLRLTGTVPPSGKIYWKLKSALHGAATYPQVLLGVMSGASVVARAAAMFGGGNLATTTICAIWAEGIITGTPGAAFTYDAAWACETGVASTGIKYGGPNDTTVNNAFGGIAFELWDACPAYSPSSGAAPTSTVHAKLDTNATYVDTEITDIRNRLPAALVSGRMDCSVGAMAAGVITAAAHAAGAIDAAALAADAGTEIGTAVWATATRALTDKSGFALTQSFPANFSSLAITAGGAVTAGTVSDKTGYALTQTFPTNFSSLAITAGGAVTAGTVSDKSGYSLTTAPLDAAGTRTALGLASANLDTQIATLATATALATVDDFLDTEIAAIKAKTDGLTFSVANKVDANACCINGATVAGAGTSGDKWRGA